MKVSKIITAVFAVTSISASSVYAEFQPQSRVVLAPMGAPMVSGVRTAQTGTLGPVATQMQSNYTGSYSQANPPTAQDLQNAWYGMAPAQQAWLAGAPGAVGVTAGATNRLYTGQYPGAVDLSLAGTPGVSGINYYRSGDGSIPYTGQYPGAAAISVFGAPGVSGARYLSPESVYVSPFIGSEYSYSPDATMVYAGRYPGAAAISVLGTPGVSGARYAMYSGTYTGDTYEYPQPMFSQTYTGDVYAQPSGAGFDPIYNVSLW